ncbi:palmitoyltransferase [Plakobranchus ocellatus]|uniref:Palmitoyltransferase n=1 Tax=Plakobranchus ocellatus TaxID=259542 RepID=A0AAV4C0K1_9GAST|nr:palmitoyltransferase [Plakobranchus ocellatus]
MSGLGHGEAQSPLSELPGDVEMDRSETGANSAPAQESLRDKLVAHYQKGMRKHRARKLTNPLTPEFINRVAVPIFLFTVTASYKIGFVDVMPLMYANNDHVILLQRCLISLIFLEMMVNWLGIRYVDSTFPRYLRLHGPPPHERLHAKGISDSRAFAPGQDKDTSMSHVAIKPVGETGDFSERRHDPIGTMSRSAFRADTLSLKEEVDLANEQMDMRNNQINARSIDDLLNPSHKRSPVPPYSPRERDLSSPSSLFSTQDASEHNMVKNGTAGNPEDKNMTLANNSSLTSPTPVITTKGNVVTQAYPYWSWVPCYPCGRARPPRCHHCPLCKTCVLKRDHHCFFAGNCVGYRNHKFFYIFLLWAWFGAMYATIHGFPYIGFFLWSDMTYMDVLFPVAIVRFLLGYIPFQAALSVTTLTLLVYFDILAGTFIFAHAWLISRGLTSFEKAFLSHSLEIKDTRSLRQKIQSVFGPYWLASFFLPVHFWTEPREDPVLWPDIQVFKR